MNPQVLSLANQVRTVVAFTNGKNKVMAYANFQATVYADSFPLAIGFDTQGFDNSGFES